MLFINFYIWYFLDHFTINSITGELETNKELDRESQALYNLTIIASDNGSPPLSSSMAVQIHVLDLNDNKPKFEKTIYDISVLENITVSSVLTTVSPFFLSPLTFIRITEIYYLRSLFIYIFGRNNVLKREKLFKQESCRTKN